MSPVPSAGKRMRVNHGWFGFYFWLVEEVVRDFFKQSQSVAMQNQSNCVITFDTQLKSALRIIQTTHIQTNQPSKGTHMSNQRDWFCWWNMIEPDWLLRHSFPIGVQACHCSFPFLFAPPPGWSFIRSFSSNIQFMHPFHLINSCIHLIHFFNSIQLNWNVQFIHSFI